jgi:two-component system, NtrC family, response regulator AtoC
MTSPAFNLNANHRLTVLFGDADSAWHDTASAMLEPFGVTSLQARTGREALDRIESGEVHVAVLDQNLPQLSGLQVVKLASRRELAPPAILLSRDLSTQFLHEALGMKVFSVLSKPVDVNLLLDTLARVLKRHYAGRWPE